MIYIFQEVKQLKDQLASAHANAQVEVQCQLADQSQELLLEITGKLWLSIVLLYLMSWFHHTSSAPARSLGMSVRA